MINIKEVINTVRADYTVKQKLNYLKFLFSSKKEIIHYNPLIISISATGNCNLSCNMCPSHSGLIPDDYPYAQQPAKDMDLEMFRKVVDRFEEALTVHIIGSGEPLLNKDFFKMVGYGRDKSMKIKTFSNGVAVSDYIDGIVNSRLNNITISINGHNKEEFHRMTGMPEGAYLKIYNGVKKLVETRNKKNSKLTIKLSFIIDHQNYKNIPHMVNLSEELGADGCLLCNFLPSPFDGFDADQRCIFSNDLEIIDSIGEIKADLPKKIWRKVNFPLFLDRKRKRKECNTYFYQIRIDGEGRAGSCSMMLLNMNGCPHFLEKGVWNHTFFRSMRRKFLEKNAELDWPCHFCPSNFGIDLLS